MYGLNLSRAVEIIVMIACRIANFMKVVEFLLSSAISPGVSKDITMAAIELLSELSRAMCKIGIRDVMRLLPLLRCYCEHVRYRML